MVENTKRVMLIKGGQTSEVVSQALKDIVSAFTAPRTASHTSLNTLYIRVYIHISLYVVTLVTFIYYSFVLLYSQKTYVSLCTCKHQKVKVIG